MGVFGLRLGFLELLEVGADESKKKNKGSAKIERSD